MNILETNNQTILKLVDTWAPRLMALTNDVITQRLSRNQWTIRQIVGHLIDSASNNTHRIVRLQYQPSPVAFPDYASLGGNDKWVCIQDYQTENWEDVVQLWKYINRHLVHVIRRIDPSKLGCEWAASPDRHISLEAMTAYYFQHLQLHLDEIEEVINPPRIVVAVDGHAGSGKSTMSAELARSVGYAYIDTGAMYRAVTLYALENGMTDEGGEGGDRIDAARLVRAMDGIRIEFRLNTSAGHSDLWLNGRCVEREIRSIEVGRFVSLAAAIPFVRARLVAMQQDMGRGKGVVMDGRDIGTVVFPEAELKIFVTATPEIRARRRYDELAAKGENPSFAEVLENVKLRDRIDETRAESPLRRAADALLLDNSNMTREEQRLWMMEQFYKTVKG